ncbi:MAG: flagellar biosynthetic protein FliR [Methylococcaceae bacterium]
MHITEAQLMEWVAAFIWPLVRISAMFISLPVLSMQSVPVRVRMILSVAITLVVMPMVDRPPPIEVFSWQGGAVVLQQLLIGIVTGFILQMVFSLVTFCGQNIAYGMGLGFATMIDPQTGIQVPVISQFFWILATFMFLLLNGHLVVLHMLIDSFNTLPIADIGFERDDYWRLIRWSSSIFSGGLLLSLPAVMTLLLVNIGFGVATRVAPQLNIMAVGFPVTIMAGMVFIWATLENLLDGFTSFLEDSYQLTNEILRLV